MKWLLQTFLALTCAFSGALWAKPVGEWSEPQPGFSDTLASLGNLGSIEEAIAEAKGQVGREPAAIETNESVGESVVNDSGATYSDSYLPIDPMKLEDLFDAVRSVPGAPASELPSGLSNGSIVGNRKPAVLPQEDPTISGLTSPPPQSFDDKSESGSLVGVDEDIEEKQARKRNSEFEDKLSELSKRKGDPFSAADYEDFRDFILENEDRLRQIELSASPFLNKAREAIAAFEGKEPDDGKSRRLKDFLAASIRAEVPSEEAAQPLLPGLRHSTGAGTRRPTAH